MGRDFHFRQTKRGPETVVESPKPISGPAHAKIYPIIPTLNCSSKIQGNPPRICIHLDWLTALIVTTAIHRVYSPLQSSLMANDSHVEAPSRTVRFHKSKTPAAMVVFFNLDETA
jgi:hypothetical protein